MTNGVKKVPELRFPGFSGEWETKELGDRVKFYSGLTYTPNDVSKNGTLVLRSSNIFNNHIINADNVYVNSDKATSTYVEYGDVVVVVRNGSRNLIGKHAVIKNEESNAVIGAFMTGIRYEFGSFINALLSTQNFQKEIHKNLGATINQITTGIFKKMTFYFPKKQEEQKIGEFFSKLDRQIELEEQKLEKLEEQKKGYMQKIFSQELRFKDENWEDYPEWEIKKLDELGEFNSGVGFPEKYQGGNTGIPFFKVSDMNLLGNEKFMNTANNYVSIEQIKQKKWKVIQNVPAIIFAKVGAAIMLNRKRMILNPFLIDNNTMSYSFSNHWDTNFGHVVFQTLNLPKYAQVGALPSYNSKDIGIIQIRLPIKEEQEKIGDFFSKLDELINKQNQKIDGLKKRKQGFLQKMFV